MLAQGRTSPTRLSPPLPHVEKKGGIRYELQTRATNLLREREFAVAQAALTELERDCKNSGVPIRELLRMEDSSTSPMEFLEAHFRDRTDKHFEKDRKMASRFASALRDQLALAHDRKKIEEWIRYLIENKMPAILPPYKENKEIIEQHFSSPDYSGFVWPLFSKLKCLTGLLVKHEWSYDDPGIAVPREALEALVRATYLRLYIKVAKKHGTAADQTILRAAHPVVEKLKSSGTITAVDLRVIQNLLSTLQ